MSAATTTTEETTTTVESINTADGNVSVTEADKAKKVVPNINFNVNVQANYDAIVKLAAQQTDEDGNPYTVHRYAKETLFAHLGLTMDGEVLRRKTVAPKVEDSLLAKALGADKVKGMTVGDRKKEENRLAKGISEQMQENPEFRAMVEAIAAKLAQQNADAAERLESAERLAK